MPNPSTSSVIEQSNREKFNKEKFFIDLRFADFINFIREQLALSPQNKQNEKESIVKKDKSSEPVQFNITPADRRIPGNSIEFAFMQILRETANKINDICETSVKQFVRGINAAVQTGTLTAAHANVATQAVQQTFNKKGGTAQISQQALAYSTAASAPSLQDIYKTRPNLTNFQARVSRKHTNLLAAEKENKNEGEKFASGMEFYGFLTFVERLSIIAEEAKLNIDNESDTILDIFETSFNKQHFVGPLQVIMYEGYSRVSTHISVNNFHRVLSNGTTSFEEANGFTLTKPPAHFATMDHMRHQLQPQPSAPTIDELENTFGNS